MRCADPWMVAVVRFRSKMAAFAWLRGCRHVDCDAVKWVALGQVNVYVLMRSDQSCCCIEERN